MGSNLKVGMGRRGRTTWCAGLEAGALSTWAEVSRLKVKGGWSNSGLLGSATTKTQRAARDEPTRGMNHLSREIQLKGWDGFFWMRPMTWATKRSSWASERAGCEKSVWLICCQFSKAWRHSGQSGKWPSTIRR